MDWSSAVLLQAEWLPEENVIHVDLAGPIFYAYWIVQAVLQSKENI